MDSDAAEPAEAKTAPPAGDPSSPVRGRGPGARVSPPGPGAGILPRLDGMLRRADQVYMVLVALVVGILGGFCAVGFRLLILGINRVAWGQADFSLAHLAALPPWWKLLVPAAGMLVVGLITWAFAREARGHGVPEVMEAVALRGSRIRPRVVLAKLAASGVCIGTGGSVGREGPIVQIGSALGSTIGQWLRIDGQRLATLVGCGAAAGIAATFNAPVAGALFSAEVILGDFGVAQFSPIVISSVAATVVSHRFLGDFPAFLVTPYRLVHPSELFAYAALGVVAGLVALAFVRVLYWTEDVFDRVAVSPPLKAVAGGILVGGVGIAAPHVLGVGYDAINEALSGGLQWPFMLGLVVLKIVAVSVTIGAGGSGGVFAPSLFIGAMLGGAVGTVVGDLWPATGGAAAYAEVGMGAVVAAATHAPITAILIIFELTSDYAIILPLMISCIIATLLSTRLQHASIYTLKLLRRGVDLRRGRAVNVLEHVPVRELMRTDPMTVGSGADLVELLNAFIDQPGSTLFVVAEEGRLLGLVTPDQVRPALENPAALQGLVIAEDVMTREGYPRTAPERTLAEVMRLLEGHRGEIPVVEDGRLVGTIWPEDVIERYNAEVFKRDMAGSMVSTVRAEGAAPLPVAPDSVVAEVPLPQVFAGRTLGELAIRARFGVSVLMVRKVDELGRAQLRAVCGAEHRLERGDVMLVLGPAEQVARLRRAVPRS